MIKAISMFSSGITSWAATKRYAEADGTEGLILLFADTYIEDDDNYRFLIEAAALIEETPTPLCAYWDIPNIRDLAERKQVLQLMASSAMREIKCLRWISDGRTPWEVMRKERIIGNSRIDPCSKILKRQLLDRWTLENAGSDVKRIYGLAWDEIHRIEKLRERLTFGVPIAPLCDRPFLTKEECSAWARSEGLEPPRMYGMGFPHANCGGFCVKAGQASFALLLQHFPDRYATHEAEEESLRDLVGDHSIMKKRTGGERKPLTMKTFRESIEAKQEIDRFDFGGCGCALDV